MKSKLLLIVCILVLLGLVFIQSYLIRNTYDLEKKEFFAELKADFDPLIDSRAMLTLQDSLGEDLKNILVQKALGSISESESKELIQQKVDSIKRLADQYIREEQRNLYNGVLRYRFTRMVFKFNGVVDSVLTDRDVALVYVGDNFKGNSGFVLRNNSTYTQTETDDYRYEFWREYIVDIDVYDKNLVIIKRMGVILALAIALILMVIVMFYSVFNALHKQKRVADIKTDFANNITHELQTPITTLGLAVKSIKTTEDGKYLNGNAELLNVINRQIFRMKNVVNQVLEASLSPQASVSSFEVRALLNDFASDFTVESHFLKFDIEFETCDVWGDSFSVERIVQNLVDNAIKYSPVGSEIRLRSYRKDYWLYVEVEDSGIGIPNDDLELIFTKFYRVPQGDLHNTKGLGLGLYLCKQLIESQGGSISVKSSLGTGSVFRIKLRVK